MALLSTPVLALRQQARRSPGLRQQHALQVLLVP